MPFGTGAAGPTTPTAHPNAPAWLAACQSPALWGTISDIGSQVWLLSSGPIATIRGTET